MKDIGAEIQQARLARGIHLEEIAHHTHIQLFHLQKIENGQFDFLPRPYVVAFIKTFAQYVGLNGEALANRWREQEQSEALKLRQQMQEAAPKENNGRQSIAARAPLKPKALAAANAVSIPLAIPYLKEILIGFGMILVMAALVFIMSRRDGGTQAETNNGAQSAKVNDQQIEEIPFEQVSQQAQKLTESKPESPTPPPTPELTLQAQFENQTRLRMVRDGQDTTITTFRSGEAKSWQAKEKFNLRLSAGGSVTLTLAGKNLGTFGQPGKIGYLTITRDRVEDRWMTPKPPRPRSAVPLDSVPIRKPQQ